MYNCASKERRFLRQVATVKIWEENFSQKGISDNDCLPHQEGISSWPQAWLCSWQNLCARHDHNFTALTRHFLRNTEAVAKKVGLASFDSLHVRGTLAERHRSAAQRGWKCLRGRPPAPPRFLSAPRWRPQTRAEAVSRSLPSECGCGGR